MIAGSRESPLYTTLRQEAARLGGRLWRNNVGACQTADGRQIRFGIANDSRAVNQNIKSGDLIGIRPMLILPQHVGSTVGVFVSRECKAPGWTFHPNDAREAAQLRWIDLVRSLGGDACFTTGESELW